MEFTARKGDLVSALAYAVDAVRPVAVTPDGGTFRGLVVPIRLQDINPA